MKKSKSTKRLKSWAGFFLVISLLLNICPMGVFIVKGYCHSTMAEKTTLSVTVVVAIILLIINLLGKLRLRSVFWVILIGIAVCLKNITNLLVIMSICVIIDEFIVTPAYHYFKRRARINKEIDRRL